MTTNRRHALIGALFLCAVGVCVSHFALSKSRPAVYSFPLSECFVPFSKCRAGDLVRIDGAIAPGTRALNQTGCATTFDLQFIGGQPAGHLPVCFDHALPQVDALSSAEQSGRLRTSVEGRFDGKRFMANQVLFAVRDAKPESSAQSMPSSGQP